MYILIFSILFLALSIIRPRWAVALILVLLPVYQIRFKLVGVPFTLLEAMILISFAVWLAQNWRNVIDRIKKRLKHSQLATRNSQLVRYPFDIEIVLILIISWIAIAVAGFSASAFGIWKAYFFEPVLVYILIYNVLFSDGPNLTLSLSFLRRGDEIASTAGDKIVPSPCARPEQGRREGEGRDEVSWRIEKLLWPLAIGAFWVSAVAIIERMTGWFSEPQFWPRATGVFDYPNAVGLFLGPLVMVMAGWLLSVIARSPAAGRRGDPAVNASFTGLLHPAPGGVRNDNLKIIFIAMSILLSLTAILLARSEGAIAGIAVALVIAGGYSASSRLIKSEALRRWGMVKLFIIALVFLAYPLIALNLFPKYDYPDTGSAILDKVLAKIELKDLSGEIRKQQWRETWQALTESPQRFIFGAGLSGYQAAVAPYHQPGIFYNFDRDPRFRNELVWGTAEYKARHWQPVEIYMYPHSFILNFWVELGLLGVLLFVWVMYKVIYSISNFSAKGGSASGGQFLKLGLFGVFIVIVVHGMVDVPYFKNDLAVLFWVLVALEGAMSLRGAERRSNPDIAGRSAGIATSPAGSSR